MPTVAMSPSTDTHSCDAVYVTERLWRWRRLDDWGEILRSHINSCKYESDMLASGVHSVDVHLAGAGPVERYTNACINWSGRRNQWKGNGFVICMNQDNVCSLLYFLFFFSFFLLLDDKSRVAHEPADSYGRYRVLSVAPERTSAHHWWHPRVICFTFEV